MRIPVSWLSQNLELPEGTTPQQLADAFVRIGLEVEEIHQLGPVTGPLVVGRVAEIEELAEFKKPIRYCQIDVGQGSPQGVVCGATNFTEGDLVIVALPGAVLPGDFAIAARKTYGRVSNGMICSARELGLADEHAGILTLPPATAAPGENAIELLGLDDTVIELAVTPDRGYCLSVRGLAREIACALDISYADAASKPLHEAESPAWPVHVEDKVGCTRFVLSRVTKLDPTAPTPWWMQRALLLCGIRPISLAVDVTNYVMLELGQPLHAFDASKLNGDMVVRRATAGETLSTLDGVKRELCVDDLIISDSTGPISLAGVMGGATTEISSTSTDIILEAAHWEPATIARAVRRHKLPSEAAKRFERFVDPALPPVAVERAAQLLARYGDAAIHRGRTDIGESTNSPAPIVMPLALPDQVAGVRYERGVTARRLSQIGCRIEIGSTNEGVAVVTAYPPSWRSDLNQQADLVEEVLRLEGYHTIPSVLPTVPAGRGLTEAQRRRRTISRALAAAGYVEILPSPFTGPATWDALSLPQDDIRRRNALLLNPLEADKPALSTTLLTGLLEALERNHARGARDLALFGMGQVVLPRTEQPDMPSVDAAQRPADSDIAALNAALPAQPLHVAAVLSGQRERGGWWGKGKEATWADAIQAARLVAHAAGVDVEISSVELMPWHPGRCAELRVGGVPVGHAGELHPKVVEALGLPKRTCAMELDLDALPIQEKRPAPVISPYPPVLLDLALVVDTSVPVAEVTDVLRSGVGELLEDIRLFDVYTGEQLPEGKRSLAFSLRLRASDRTLTAQEANEARDTAVAQAAKQFGAALRV